MVFEERDPDDLRRPGGRGQGFGYPPPNSDGEEEQDSDAEADSDDDSESEGRRAVYPETPEDFERERRLAILRQENEE